MKPMPLAIAAALAAVVALVGCGGSDDNGSSGSSGSDVAVYCDKVKELKDLGSTFGNLSSSDLAGAKDAFQQAEDKLQEIDDVAPSNVKADVDKVLSIFTELNDAVQGADSAQDLQQSLTPLRSDVADLNQTMADLKSQTTAACKK